MPGATTGPARSITAANRPRGAGTKGVPRPQREQLILDAATEEFGRYGYAGASLGNIASGAGVSKPLVLTYFGSKDGVFAACVERAGSNLADRIEVVLAAHKPPLDTARDTLEAMVAGLQARPRDWNVISDRTIPLSGVAHEAAERVRATIAGQARRGVARLADLELLADGDDVSMLTDIWMHTVTAIIGWWLRHPEQSAQDISARTNRILTALLASAEPDGGR